METGELVNKIKTVFDSIAHKYGACELQTVYYGYKEVSFGYKVDTFGIDVEIDLSSFAIFVLIFKFKEDKIPVDYEDEFGNLQRIHIQEALNRIGLDISRERNELRRLSGNSNNCTAIVNILSKLLDDNWNILLSKTDIIFHK